ncbi:hypothetical protein [Arenicella xantha]|uniref:Uncharacterized protein involved in exopolysaccharide biosynthesis n=1 Tax=Arenicella xantha TaxID=644221 RepID=A0A395JLD8_9GAMM|nr:hypothetical protein [Arenicella xantha]RBP51419.1 uncharacterized protein involved in exopolysaccharide biosynthesis [Arenicella xantha]
MNWPLLFDYAVVAALTIKYRLLGIFIAIVVMLALYLSLAAPSYKTSWVMLLPGTERGSTINLDNLGEARSSGANAYGSVSISPKNTYKEIALSDAVIKQAATEYGVEAYAFSKPRITLIDQTPAMQFTLKGESKEELAYRAKLYNRIFHSVLDQLRDNEIERGYEGVEDNLADAKARLSKARLDIVQFQSNTSLISEDQLKRWVSDAEELRSKGTTTSIELASAEASLKSRLQQLGITQKQAEALLITQSNPELATTLDSLSVKLAEQSSLHTTYGAANPLRTAIDREVSGLAKRVRTLLSDVPNLNRLNNKQLYALASPSNAKNIQITNNLITELASLKAQSASIADNFERYLARVSDHAEDAATLADLQRSHQIAEAIFSSALAKLDTNRLDIYATYPLTQLLTEPGSTLKRDRLQSKLMIVAGILIFGLLSMALLLIELRKQLTTTMIKANHPSMPDAGATL